MPLVELTGDCRLERNTAGSAGAGTFNSCEAIRMDTGSFVSNSALSCAAANLVSCPSFEGIDCNFLYNSALVGTNGALSLIQCSARLSTSSRPGFFTGNSAAATGGGIYFTDGGRGNLLNCVVARNSAPYGGGISIGLSSVIRARHCTIAENSSEGIRCYFENQIKLTNCIVWANAGIQITAGETVHFSNVEGGYPGPGNINDNPLFTNPDAFDWSIALGSPCVDTGTNCGIFSDCIGKARPMLYGYDMGAYELDPSPVLAIVPLVLDFGVVDVGKSAQLPVLLENTGNGWLTGTVYNVPVPIFTVSPSSYIMPPNSTTGLVVSFAPPISYAWTQTVTFASNGGNLDLDLIGRGIPEPLTGVLASILLFVCLGRRPGSHP